MLVVHMKWLQAIALKDVTNHYFAPGRAEIRNLKSQIITRDGTGIKTG
jgi:hypothetical protein